MNKEYKATILVVDDEAAYRKMVSAVLVDAGFEVLLAESGKQALEISSRRLVDLALLDLMMPKMDGRELMQKLHARLPGLPVVFLTAHGSIPSAVEAIKEGASDYLTKPLPHVDDLILTIDRILELTKLKKQNNMKIDAQRKQDLFPSVSPAMKKVLEMAKKVANTDVTVLITGESGTGKERMAQYIHLHSQRANMEIVPVNCAAIVETLLESELFGHEKGAFTGASERKPGCFELASNSTLFLDEIGEMSISLQPKLLRALQEKEFRRVGGTQLIRFNSRLIAATNKDLKQQCALGNFREDLFYRISVFTLSIPPLRSRPEDIIFLAKRFIASSSERFGKEAPEISQDFEESLLNYDWPGNVRELENVIEASVLLCEEDTLQPQHLHGITLKMDKNDAAGDTLIDAEKKVLLEALAKFDGHREKTAAFLGMSKRNLIYKLKKHNLTRTKKRKAP
jgi:DNA-binding NtrC family response regulator